MGIFASIYLMHHACAARFDVIENLENFYKVNKAFGATATSY